MAIINAYPKDINIQDKDAWIGTDSYNRQTKQYTAEAVANYLNIKGKVSIANQVNYKFVNIAKYGAGTIALPTGSRGWYGYIYCIKDRQRRDRDD